MEVGWHVASSQFKTHPLLEFYLHVEDAHPFVFGRGKAKKVLAALTADKDRFVALMSALVGDTNWKGILEEAMSSTGSEDGGQQAGTGWHVRSGIFKKHEVLEFCSDENDQWPFTFGRSKAARLYEAVVADPSKFFTLITRFVDAGDWENLCVAGVYTKDWQSKSESIESDDGGELMKKVIEAMQRADLRELVKKLVDDASD